MRAIVCGSRDSVDRDGVFAGLDEVHAKQPISLVIEGGADGVDHFAFLWAAERKVGSLTVDADWNKYGKAAGPIRNRAMLDERPDVVIAFIHNSGPGTANMIRQAENSGVLVIKVGGP
jgi:hypothetical protein